MGRKLERSRENWRHSLHLIYWKTLKALFFDTKFQSLDKLLKTPENTHSVLNKARLVVERIIEEAK